jgi:glycosyltransferase involved in cell wall biosynthesis
MTDSCFRNGQPGSGARPLPRVGLVGPLPPPSGGMANQCEQLVQLLRSEGVEVEIVRTNSPYQPLWIGHVPFLRAVFRLVPYLAHLWRVAGRVDVMHLLANSGWAWHLFAAPAIFIARARGTPIIVNYRGGGADPFFSQDSGYVLRMLSKASMRVTPSVFLQRVFAKHGLSCDVIPNIIDLSRFTPTPLRKFGDSPHIVVTRNLEPIYDIPTAIRAFAGIRRAFVGAKMTVAGSGPELGNLRALVTKLKLDDSVQFSGRIENADIPALYASADCMINSSTVDNMPISILEAFASGVPVVSTCAGGIPDMVKHGESGLLVSIGDADAMAREVLHVLRNPEIALRLRQAGMADAEKYAWSQVRVKWLDAYAWSASSGGAA